MTTDDTHSHYFLLFFGAWDDDLSSPVFHSQRRMEGAWGSHPLPGMNFLNYFEAAVLGQSRNSSRKILLGRSGKLQTNTKHGERWDNYSKSVRMAVASTLGFRRSGWFLMPLFSQWVNSFPVCCHLNSTLQADWSFLLPWPWSTDGVLGMTMMNLFAVPPKNLLVTREALYALLRYQTFAIPRCKRVLSDPLQMSAWLFHCRSRFCGQIWSYAYIIMS